MSSPSDDPDRYVPLETGPPDAFVYAEGDPVADWGAPVEGSGPSPGPPGYHADFTRVFGLPETADSWVVLASGDSYGPFPTEDEALRWAIACAVPAVWYVVPLRKPEDWPGAGLEDPEEAETPLLDLISDTKEAP